MSQEKMKSVSAPFVITSSAVVRYLPPVAPYCGVDVLLQQLLWLQLMNPESFEQLSNLLVFQGFQTVQQGGVHYADILV